MNKSNLLFDKGNFIGLLDFNLSGTDAVLAYAFYESFCYMAASEFEAIKQGAVSVPIVEKRLRRNFSYVALEYTFVARKKSRLGHTSTLPFRSGEQTSKHTIDSFVTTVMRMFQRF